MWQLLCLHIDATIPQLSTPHVNNLIMMESNGKVCVCVSLIERETEEEQRGRQLFYNYDHTMIVFVGQRP